MLDKAIALASKAFEGTFDKGGKPYILHLLHVMYKVEHLGETAMICAVLHDLIEDKKEHGYDIDLLYKEGYSLEVIHILGLLTHNPNDDYMDYIKRLSTHPIAKAIKMADIEHNSQVSRLKGLRKKDFDRLEKYCYAYQYLKN